MNATNPAEFIGIPDRPIHKYDTKLHAATAPDQLLHPFILTQRTRTTMQNSWLPDATLMQCVVTEALTSSPDEDGDAIWVNQDTPFAICSNLQSSLSIEHACRQYDFASVAPTRSDSTTDLSLITPVTTNSNTPGYILVTPSKASSRDRKEQNRKAQRAFRDRQIKAVNELKAKCEQLTKANTKLRAENEGLENSVKLLVDSENAKCKSLSASRSYTLEELGALVSGHKVYLVTEQ